MGRRAALGAVIVVWAAAWAAADPVGVRIAAKNAAVLAASGLDAAGGGTAHAGEVYGAVARTDYWIQIVFNGGTGWVAAADLEESGPVPAVRLTRDAVVHVGPGTAFAASGAASTGQTYAWSGSADGFVEITFAGGSGYVSTVDAEGAWLGGRLAELGGSAVPVHARMPAVAIPPGMGVPGMGFGNPLDPLNGMVGANPLLNQQPAQNGGAQQQAAPAAAPVPPQYTQAGNSSTTYSGAAPATSSTGSGGGGGGGKCWAAGFGPLPGRAAWHWVVVLPALFAVLVARRKAA